MSQIYIISYYSNHNAYVCANTVHKIKRLRTTLCHDWNIASWYCIKPSSPHEPDSNDSCTHVGQYIIHIFETRNQDRSVQLPRRTGPLYRPHHGIHETRIMHNPLCCCCQSAWSNRLRCREEGPSTRYLSSKFRISTPNAINTHAHTHTHARESINSS